MLFEELLSSFLYSRKNGIKAVGAKRKASPVTLSNYEFQLEIFFDFMRDKRERVRWSDLNRADIRAYIEFVNDNAEWSVSTKLTYFRTLRTLINFIEKDEECEGLKSWKKELPAIGQNESRKDIPSPQELKLWRRSFDTKGLFGFRNYVAFSLWVVCGLRNDELSSLKIEHVHLEDRQLLVHGKTGFRVVPMTYEVAKLIKTWLKRREGLGHAKDSPFVFVGHHGERCKPNGFGQVFRKMRKANPALPRVSPQIVRHAFGTYYLRNGGNMERLRIILGHSTYNTTKGYLHLAQVGSDHMKEELEQVSPLKMLNERTREV